MKAEFFANLYFLIKTSESNTLKQVGKLLYNLKEHNVFTREELNVLFEIYETAKKAKTDKEIIEEDEEIMEEAI